MAAAATSPDGTSSGGSGVKPMYLFYHLAGEKGESSVHPNACRLYPADPARVTLAEVVAGFPLTGTSAFHFRFQVAADKQVMFLDLTSPDDVVPQVNGALIAKVLRLDTARCATNNSYGLRLKLRPAGSTPAAVSPAPAAPAGSPGTRTAAAAAAGAAAGGGGSGSGSGYPASSPSATAATAAAAGGAATAGARASSGASSVIPPSPAALLGGAPGMRPVKVVEDTAPVVVPDVVDADLADKSDYVKARVMERRNKVAEEHARRVAEVAEREAAAKKEQEDRDAALAKHGPRLKEWAEEASGTRKNLRLLLSTLQAVLWPEASWEPVAMARLIDPKRVKIAYLRALTIVHPDKQNSMDGDHRFIATQVFNYLESAYRAFQEAEMGGS